MGVLYVSFGSKVRPITFGCVAMGSVIPWHIGNAYDSYAVCHGFESHCRQLMYLF